MKIIPQERIFKALENARYLTYIKNQCTREIEELMMLGSMHGLKIRLGANEQNEANKVKLECTYAGFDPYDPDTPKKVIAEWHRILERYWARKNKVLGLQEKYKVSGLEKELIQYKQHSFTYLYPDSDLSSGRGVEKKRRSCVKGFEVFSGSERPEDGD